MSLCLAVAGSTIAQEPTPTTTPPETPAASDDGIPKAIHMVGLPDAKPGIKGVLKLTPETIDFTSDEIHALIAYKRITAVSIGSERTEGGGTTGKVVRRIPMMGIGSVAGLASQKQADLLTIEFRDPHEGYHGAVFMLPTKTAADLQKEISAQITPPTPVDAPACVSGTATPNSVLIAPIGTDGIDLPAEYRVLLYEHLYSVLRTTGLTRTYFRTGDTSAGPGCTALTLHVVVVGFKKGNQTLRTSTGPIGHLGIMGATSLMFNVKLDDAQGRTVLDDKVKKSKRGDSDSLGVAHDIAKNISKRIDKAMAKTKSSGTIS
jgi:hypothetical protein